MAEYTPDSIELVDAYEWSRYKRYGDVSEEARLEAESGIAKIKADVLREALAEVEEYWSPGACDPFNSALGIVVNILSTKIEEDDE